MSKYNASVIWWTIDRILQDSIFFKPYKISQTLQCIEDFAIQLFYFNLNGSK